MPVPVHLVAGDLGVGKTTALLHLLGELGSGARTAIVVNDFGASSLDAAAAESGATRVAEIRDACVCCTAPEGFVAAVQELLDTYEPDRILVEPTGLAVPADLIDTLRRAPYADRIELQPTAILVDPTAIAAAPDGAAAERARIADVLVANRTDLASPAALEAFDAWVAELWPQPLAVVRTTHGRIPLDALAWPEGAGPGLPGTGHTHHHAADHQVRSWSWPPDAVFVHRRLRAALESLAPGLRRLKGVFRTDEGTTRIDLAQGTLHTAPSAWRRDSRVDAISTAAEAPTLDALDAALRAALRRPEEQEQAGEELELAALDGATRVVDRAALVALPGQVPDVSKLVPGRSGAAAPVAAVLGPQPAATVAVVVAADGYATPPVPVRELADALLLHSLDGAPLPRSKGGPFRLLIPGDAGGPCANVKGVVRIALRAGEP